MPPLKIYLVEDSAVIREHLSSTLGELAAAEVVGWAEDEATAIAWMQSSAPRAVLLVVDLFLKSGSGLGVLRAARSLAPARRRVVLSNYVTPEMRQHCLALGADRVFDKSRDIEDLIAYCRGLAGVLDEPHAA